MDARPCVSFLPVMSVRFFEADYDYNSPGCTTYVCKNLPRMWSESRGRAPGSEANWTKWSNRLITTSCHGRGAQQFAFPRANELTFVQEAAV